MPQKSIFRQPGAQHFQLVHRSQRDPLIHDPDASQHVLKQFIPSNIKKGKSRAELEKLLSTSDVDHDQNAHVGEASLYGIYFDDTEYDYMQHLRPVGVQEEGVDSVLIEAPSTSKSKSKPKDNAKSKEPISLRDLPPEVLPSTSELPRNFESQQAIPSSIAGFRPDMDPHLRQALEALEDDAFVDDGLEDDFFGELVKEGERGDDEEFAFEFDEEGLSEEGVVEATGEDADEGGWEARFAQFKKDQKFHPPPPSDSDADSNQNLDINSEGGDTIGRLPKLPVIGGKRRRKGTSDASGYSMSSSSMFRTEALVTLDERFDQVMQKEYGENDSENEDDEDDISATDSDSDAAPDLITTREDFEAMMDDFLDNYELLGRKMKPVMPGETGAEKLDTLRRAMGRDERVRVAGEGEEDEDEEILMPFENEDKKDRWDCETILTTYSNLENHPRLIRARDGRPVPKIKLDSRTGLPTVFEQSQIQARPRRDLPKILSTVEDEEGADEHKQSVRTTITRPRDESKEDKKARKQAVKTERQARRADKKATKEQFEAEIKHQLKGIGNKEKAKTRKL